MKRVTIEDAPAVLNLNDRAMWVLGFNEALERCAAEVKGLDCAHGCGVGWEIAANLNGTHGVPVTAKWPSLDALKVRSCGALGEHCEWPKTCEERGSCAYGVSVPGHQEK